MGFRKAGSSDIVDVKQCPILVPHLEALLPEVRTCSPAGRRSPSRACRTGHGKQWPADGAAPYRAIVEKDREKLERFSHSHDLALFLAPQSEILEQVTGEAPWYASNGLRLTFSPRDFIQVNDGVNQQMVEKRWRGWMFRKATGCSICSAEWATSRCRWRESGKRRGRGRR
jgi:23S rRNA (uracil1939-C5)-methyltransferase